MSQTPPEVREDEVPLLPGNTQKSPKSRLRQILNDRIRLIAAFLLALVLLVGAAAVYYFVRLRKTTRSGLAVGKNGAVATELRECSQLGLSILKAGGNAMDAAIASALCIGTTNAFSSGIGGGGFLIYKPANLSIPPKVINFRESAPAAATKNMYHGDESLAQRGGLSVSVPGEIRGYEIAHQMFGRLPWADLFRPNIEIARKGIPCPEELAARLQVYGQSFPKDPDWSPVYAPKGHLLKPGETLKRLNFADTLEKIARNGSAVFYEGEIAHSLVSHCQKHGGILTLEDMRDYEARVEDPLASTYRDLEILTCGAPSSGPVLIEALNILENYDMADIGPGPLGHHYLVESMKYMSAGRTELGDPFYLKRKDLARVAELQDKHFAASCAANISESQTFDWEHYNPKYDFTEDHGTTSLSVIDAEGNAVSITTTVNLIFGSGLMDPVTGIILNDEMDDHSIPGVTNAFGLRPSVLNYIEAGKRSMSSQTPTVVTRGNELLTLGGSGGSRIVTAILDAIVKRYDWSFDLFETIRQPRVHHQLLPNVVSAESTLDGRVKAGLLERGHVLELYSMGLPRSEIQAVEKKAGLVSAMSDARKRGQAAAY
ncbi:protein of unknown function [Taphrina deformans PYCC 5710]|uniref:Glutathione hydrolase n=1 Tax=Taphrina deformans (strain PYCC 5710 / ATCC 11124 / CBS 356.35 / IMI 108563 / JCM 9778 / NBRC 8474) TaxID=1097556 RepID=R4XHI3_TAPDE|nr:protein of unknown function [Taphrina deformans PYCC 5710]|eukprot:CCG83988.1 protein of unknown function [Taphrina deformans PYCC 5710]